MLYVLTLDSQPGRSREERDSSLVRRAQWKYPDGVEVLGEYWLATESPAVVVVLKAESFAPLMEINLAWGDAFQISAYPAVTPEEGLALGAEAMARRSV